jgi:hypothetical protein
VRICDDVVFHDLQGELVLLNLKTGVYFGLDSVGTRIWHLIREHGSPFGSTKHRLPCTAK